MGPITRKYCRCACLLILVFVCSGLFLGAERTFPLLTYCLVNLLLLSLALSYRKRFFPAFRGADGPLLFASLYLAFLVIGLTALGVLGLLTLPNCCIVFLSLFLVSTPLLAGGSRLSPIPRYLGTKSGMLSSEKYLLAFALTVLVILLSYRIFTPPSSYDDLMYHLSYPVEWLKSSSISMPPPTPFGYPWLSYFPFDGELLLFWLLIPLRSDFLAKFGQSGFVFLGIAAVYSLSRRVGMKKGVSLLASLFALAIPRFLHQGVFRCGNDILFACLFLMSLNFLLRLTRHFTTAGVLSFSIAFGLLVGTKTLGLTYGLPLLLVFVYTTFSRRKESLLSALSLLLICLLIVLALGGASYVRNFLATGNPLYPLRVTLGTMVLFSGPVGKEDIYRSWQTALHPLEDYPALALIIFSSTAAGFLGLRRLRFRPRIVFLSATALYIAAIYYFGFMRNTRYLYAGMLLSAVTLCWVAGELPPRHRRRALAFIRWSIFGLLLFSLWNLFSSPKFSAALLARGLLFLCSLTIIITLAWFSLVMLLRCKHTLSAIASVLVTTLFIVSSLWLILNAQDAYDANKYSCKEWLLFTPRGDGKAWKWVDEHAGRRGKTIAFAGLDNSYPLYGNGFRNDVAFVPRGRKSPSRYGLPIDKECCLVYVGRKGGWVAVNDLDADKRNAETFGWDYDLWLDNLGREGVDWLFVRGTYRKKGDNSIAEQFEYPLEDEWASTHPEDFRLIYSSKTFRIYERTL